MSRLRLILGILCLLIFLGIGQETWAESSLKIEDQDGVVWQQDTEIALFGEKEALIYPTKEGSYQFTVENQSDEAQHYQFVMSLEDENNIPVDYQIYRDNQMLYGDKDGGKQLTEDISKEQTIGAKKTVTYKIDWSWDGYVDDERDTGLGTKANQEDLYHRVSIQIQTGDQNNISGEGNLPLLADTQGANQKNSISNFLFPKTGSTVEYWWVYSGLLLIAIAMILVWLRRRRDDEEENLEK